MNRPLTRLLGLALFAGSVFAVQAQTAEPARDAAPTETADAAQDAKARKDGINDRHCLRHTGTLIRQHGNRRDRCASHFGRAYTREDLERTGRIDLADALRTLDPSVY